MIKFSLPDQNINSIIDEYRQDRLERKIIDKMNDTQTVLNYKDTSELKFEVDLRKHIVDVAFALDNSGMDFAVFRKTRCNEKFWDRQNNGGFELKNGVSASEAISDILKNPRKYATECATAMVMVYYLAILQMYPRELFDKTFNKIILMNWHNIDRDMGRIGMMNDKSNDIPGDRRYFKNPDVDLSTPEWQGENVIDLGNGKYYGHGIGIYSADAIIKSLNENRKEGADTSAYLMETAGNPDYKNLYSIYKKYQQQSPASVSA